MKTKKETKTKKEKISKKTTFSELLKKHPDAAEILFKEGLYCIGCPMSMQETIEEGSLAHGLDPDKLVEKINKKLKQRN